MPLKECASLALRAVWLLDPRYALSFDECLFLTSSGENWGFSVSSRLPHRRGPGAMAPLVSGTRVSADPTRYVQPAPSKAAKSPAREHFQTRQVRDFSFEPCSVPKFGASVDFFPPSSQNCFSAGGRPIGWHSSQPIMSRVLTSARREPGWSTFVFFSPVRWKLGRHNALLDQA